MVDDKNGETGRPIETVEDVHAVLDGRVSFEEALDCVRVARAEGDWGLVDRCAVAALEAIGSRSVAPRSIEEAALNLAAAAVQQADSLEYLPPLVTRAAERLETLAKRNPRIVTEIDAVRTLLSEVAVLLADDRAASYVSLCARLRKLDRADLGRASATRALDANGDDQKALTTRGGAGVDLDDLPAAEADLMKAWDLGESAYVANALSRLRLRQDRATEALEWAKTAVHLEPGTASWATLAAAARVCDDDEAFETAIQELTISTDSQLSLFEAGLSKRWPLYLAATALVRAGRLEEATAIAEQLEHEDYAPAKRLRTEIRIAQRRQGGPSDAGSHEPGDW